MIDGHALRRLRRRLREASRDNAWLIPLLGGILGILLSRLVPTEPDLQSGWTITVDRSRDTLFGVLGLMFTALSIVLALASVAAQNVVGRFGSRTLRLYLRRSPERWVIGSYALAFAFTLFEQFQMRTLPSDAPTPTSGVVLAVILLIGTGCMMIAYIAAVVRWFRVDRAVIALRHSALEASRAATRDARSGCSRTSIPPRPDGALDLNAPRSGHLADVDIELLFEQCRRLDAEAVITEPIGAAVVKGHPLGWLRGRASDIEPDADLDLAEVIDVSGTREVGESVEYGLIGMVDVAIIALSPAVNNPNTAVEVIEEMEFLFARLHPRDLGPYSMGEAEGSRAVATARSFGDLVELGTTQIVQYGISDPIVRRALRRLARSLRLLDLDDDDRAQVEQFAARLEPKLDQ